MTSVFHIRLINATTKVDVHFSIQYSLNLPIQDLIQQAQFY